MDTRHQLTCGGRNLPLWRVTIHFPRLLYCSNIRDSSHQGNRKTVNSRSAGSMPASSPTDEYPIFVIDPTQSVH